MQENSNQVFSDPTFDETRKLLLAYWRKPEIKSTNPYITDTAKKNFQLALYEKR
jgi:hypothetical protein